jgi:hypothetical protein
MFADSLKIKTRKQHKTVPDAQNDVMSPKQQPKEKRISASSNHSHSSSSDHHTPSSSPRFSNNNQSQVCRTLMRLSLPNESKEVTWLLMVFDPKVTNVNDDESVELFFYKDGGQEY